MSSAMTARLRFESRWDLLCSVTLWLVNGYLLTCSLLLYLAAFHNAPINADAGTYLSISDKIRSGIIPFRDLSVGYSPLSFYLFAFTRAITPAVWADYNVYLGTLFALIFAQCALVFLILRRHDVSLALATCAALLSSLLLYYHDGIYIVLEPFVTFFVLLSFYILIRNSNHKFLLLISGLCACAAFLSKQYGLAAFPGLAAYICIRSTNLKNGLKSVFWFGLGWILSLASFAAYFQLSYGIPMISLVQDLSLRGYAPRVSPDSFVYKDFIFYKCHILILAPIGLLLSLDRERALFIGLGLLFSIFSLSFLVRTFPHYFGLVIAYAVMLQFLTLHILEKKGGFWRIPALCLALVIAYETHCQFKYNLIRLDLRTPQYELSKAINQVWPAQSPVLAYANPWIMFTAKFNPIDWKKPGFGFLANYSAAEQLRLVKKSQKILINPLDQTYFINEAMKFDRGVAGFWEILESENFKLITSVNGFELWERG